MTTPTPRTDAEWLKAMSDQYGALQHAKLRGDREAIKAAELWLSIIASERWDKIIHAQRDLAARDAELAAMKQGKILADGMANMIRGFILKTVERETLDESAAKYRKWEEDYCHSNFRKPQL